MHGPTHRHTRSQITWINREESITWIPIRENNRKPHTKRTIGFKSARECFEKENYGLDEIGNFSEESCEKNKDQCHGLRGHKHSEYANQSTNDQ